MEDRQQFTLRIEGMTCDGCARHVTTALKGVAGVEDARVGDGKQGIALVVAEPQVSEEKLPQAASEVGYRAVAEEKRPLKPGTQIRCLEQSFQELQS
jgi:copper chaperone CopZ